MIKNHLKLYDVIVLVLGVEMVHLVGLGNQSVVWHSLPSIYLSIVFFVHALGQVARIIQCLTHDQLQGQNL